MSLRPSQHVWIFFRGVAIGLALVLCLPPGDLWAASSRSIFADKVPDYEAVRARNLDLLEQRRHLHQRRPRTADQRLQSGRKAQALALAALQDLAAITLPEDAGQILDVWSPDDRDSSLVARLPARHESRATDHDLESASHESRSSSHEPRLRSLFTSKTCTRSRRRSGPRRRSWSTWPSVTTCGWWLRKGRGRRWMSRWPSEFPAMSACAT